MYTVPAIDNVVLRCFVIPTNFSKERWVTKVEYAPGDRKLVHHILSYIDTTSAAENLDRADPGPGYTCFGGPGFTAARGPTRWAPGRPPRGMGDRPGLTRPERAGRRLAVARNKSANERRTQRSAVAPH